MSLVAVSLAVLLQGQMPAQVADQTPEPLQALCDAGGKTGPGACYRLALLYREGRGVARDLDRAMMLVKQACRGNQAFPYEHSYSACFTAFLWGEDTSEALGNDREQWVFIRDVVRAPNLERRKQLVASSRRPGVLRYFLDPGSLNEIRALPDLAGLQEAVRARIVELARTDPDWSTRRFCVEDRDAGAAVPFEVVQEIAQNDPHPEVRAAARRVIAWVTTPLFDPPAALEKVKNSRDPETRRQALVGVRDHAFLARIAEKDPDPGVRSEAVDRLEALATPETRAETDAILARIAEKDKDHEVRIAAAAGVEDQKALERLAKTSPVNAVRSVAVGKIADQSVLLWVAEHDSEKDIRKEAVRRLTDQGSLRRIGTSRMDGSVRATAVERLQDQKLLADLAVGDKDEAVYREAIRMLTDQSLLGEVMRRRPEILGLVVVRLTDQGLLRTVLKTSSDVMIRAEAARQITDPALAIEVAETAPDWLVRKTAVEKISDPAVLLRVARNDVEAQVRAAAVNNLGDAGALVDLEKTTPHKDVRWAVAKKRMASDPAEAATYARSEDPIIRRLAAGVLKDQALLGELAKKDPDHDVRLQAIDRLTDRAVLGEIARSATRPDEQAAAAYRLKQIDSRR